MILFTARSCFEIISCRWKKMVEVLNTLTAFHVKNIFLSIVNKGVILSTYSNILSELRFSQTYLIILFIPG